MRRGARYEYDDRPSELRLFRNKGREGVLLILSLGFDTGLLE